MPVMILGKRSRELRFSDSEIGWSIFFDQSRFRLQGIFEVVTKRCALGAVILARTIQNFFDLPSLADYIAPGDQTSCGSSNG
jgi:hypothetical protein